MRKKNQFFSSGEKTLDHTKKFKKQKSSISLSYTWNGLKFLPQTKTQHATAKNQIFWKCQIFQNLNFTIFRKIVAQGWKMTNEGIFPIIQELIHRLMDPCFWIGTWTMYIDIRGTYIDLGTLSPTCMDLNRPPLVGLMEMKFIGIFKINIECQPAGYQGGRWEPLAGRSPSPSPSYLPEQIHCS